MAKRKKILRFIFVLLKEIIFLFYRHIKTILSEFELSSIGL